MSGAVRRPSRANPRPSGTGSAPGGQTHADQSDPNAATIDLNAPTGGDERRTQRQQRADALAGKELGDVTIQGLLGKGGMATVYRGLQRGLERQVAVKVLSPRLTKDPQQVEQFLREARTLARLEHPNIVTVYQVGQLDDLHYLVMQLIEGGSLVDRLKAQGGQLPVAEAVDCARQIALGLGEAHLKGIVHRDIKPANVLCAPGGVLKITDYGLARMVDDSGASFGRGGWSGPRTTWPPSRSTPARSTPAPTSTPSARPFTTC